MIYLKLLKLKSSMINLEKEKFNLNDFIKDILYDYENKVSKEDFNNNSTITIIKYLIPQDVIFFVEADKDKLI